MVCLNVSNAVPLTTVPQVDYQSTKLIFRLGWISFILGICTFFIHYISIDRLANYSPINAGIISGIFLIIAGLASVNAGYKEISYRSFQHAQIWSFIVMLIFTPGLIIVSIIALILDSQDYNPPCQQTLLSPSRAMLFGNNIEIYPSSIACIETTKLYNVTQILNTIQFIIGVVCFFIHVILLSIQRKVIQRMKMNNNENMIIYPQAIVVNMNHATSHSDSPPKYEDLQLMQSSVKQ